MHLSIHSFKFLKNLLCMGTFPFQMLDIKEQQLKKDQTITTLAELSSSRRDSNATVCQIRIKVLCRKIMQDEGYQQLGEWIPGKQK